MREKLSLFKNPIVSIGIVLLVIIGIVFTIYALQQRQEVRQRAAEPIPACTVTQAKCTWGSVSNITGYHVKIVNMTTGKTVQDQNVGTNVHQTVFPASSGITYRCEVSGISACGDDEGGAGIAVNVCPGTSPVPTVTLIPTATPTQKPTPTPTGTLTPTPTPTLTPTPTHAPTGTPVPTATPTPVVIISTPTPVVIVSQPTNTPAPTATPHPTLAPTGPGDNITIAGSAAFGVLLIGAVLFFIL